MCDCYLITGISTSRDLVEAYWCRRYVNHLFELFSVLSNHWVSCWDECYRCGILNATWTNLQQPMIQHFRESDRSWPSRSMVWGFIFRTILVFECLILCLTHRIIFGWMLPTLVWGEYLTIYFQQDFILYYSGNILVVAALTFAFGYCIIIVDNLDMVMLLLNELCFYWL